MEHRSEQQFVYKYNEKTLQHVYRDQFHRRRRHHHHHLLCVNARENNVTNVIKLKKEVCSI